MKKIFMIVGISIISIFVLLSALIFIQVFVLDNILYPNDLYKKMNEVRENKTLIGLTEEELVELLGEPRNILTESGPKTYEYDAGTTVKKSIFVGDYQMRSYELRITFDENNKVRSAIIKKIL